MKIHVNVLIVFILFSLVLLSCEKNSYPPEISKAQINLNITIGPSETLEWDTIKYINEAGNKYGINKLIFYLSNITLKQENGEVYSSAKVFYMDPSDINSSFLHLDSVPPAKYTEFSFLLGLDSINNKTFALTPTIENSNMAWPDMMGGGYHFMKMEGNYMDSTQNQKGYAIHLGKNKNLPRVSIKTDLNQKYWDHRYSLFFDLNEVFKNPYTFDFTIDNNYTMSDSIAMDKIKYNIENAFSLLQNN